MSFWLQKYHEFESLCRRISQEFELLQILRCIQRFKLKVKLQIHENTGRVYSCSCRTLSAPVSSSPSLVVFSHISQERRDGERSVLCPAPQKNHTALAWALGCPHRAKSLGLDALVVVLHGTGTPYSTPPFSEAAASRLRLPVSACSRKSYASTFMKARCLLSAAPPWPPSTFS